MALRLRPQHIAAISTSHMKSATALERQSSPGQPLTASGKVRSEVPLASQEKKEGAMQYVLYVSLLSVLSSCFPSFFILTNPYIGPPLTKLPIGLARALCGR